MDDLDHSVLIAEQDWDCFYTESEECSIQQAKLAALDDSGLSDTEDDKTSTQVPSYSAQTTPSAEEQKQYLAVECEPGHTSEKSELNESAGHTCDTILNEQEVTSECSVLDQTESNEESSCTEPSHLVINNLKRNSESQGENKSCQANIKSVSETSSLCNRDIKHENGTESTGTEVTDSLPLLRKEKERWFVTVNDSPVRLREKVGTSGQKKRRKKNPSRNVSQQSAADCERRSRVNNTEAEKDIFERQSMPEKFEQPPKRDSTNVSITYLNSAHKESHSSNSHNIQDLQSSSSIESTPDDLIHFINHTEEGSPRFILGASTTIAPSDSEGERTEQQEIFEQESSPQETPCRETSSNRAQTPDETLGPTQPIFAMSSFWDEMEKLTINDILELRIANNKPQLIESFIPEEGKSLDTIDAHIDDPADLDYFTHLDDCKPDRSSCEFSTFSNYDEEFLLHGSTNPSPAPSESKEQCFLKPTCARNLFQEDSDQIWPSYQSKSNETVRLYPESDLLLFMFYEVEAQMPDMLLKTTQDNNLGSFMLDHCDIRRSTPSPVLSMSDILDDQCLMSFFEILKDDQDSEQFQTKANISVSFPFSQNLLSVPETYNDFFSDFEVGNFLFPSVKGTPQCEKNTVPIYSSSRSVVKDLTFPKVEEMVQSDSEDEKMTIRVITHFSGQQRCASPSGTPILCFNTNHRNTWRNLSLRRIKFSFMGRTWCRMATSWVSRKTADTTFQENWDIAKTSNSSKAHPKVPVLLLENETLGYSKEEEIYVGQTVPGPGRDRFRYSIKQGDMCLVCIAFASWVLKSTNPQSTDMWKAALLANVSAISAIQYLRRYIKEDDEP